MKPSTAISLSAAIALAACGDLSLAFQSPTTFAGSRPSSSSHWNAAAPTPRSRRTQRQVVMVEDPTMATSTLDAFFQSQPYLAAFLTCSVKAGTADLLAQKQILSPAKPSGPEEAKEAHPFDLPRNLSFIFYGGLVQGMFQQFLFSAVYPVMFGHEHTFLTTVQQVAFDVGVMPFVYLPIVYTIKSLFGASNNSDLSLATVQDGLAKLGDDILNKGLLKTYWSIWIPAQSLTFSVIPPHLRVLFVALVSFCWVTILSSISSSSSSSSPAMDAEASTKATTAPATSSSRPLPSLPSAEGLMDALQRGADALRLEAGQLPPLPPSSSRRRRPAYVAVSAASRPAEEASREPCPVPFRP